MITAFRRSLLVGALLFSALPLLAGTPTISLDVTKPGPRLDSRLYGIFLEEINFGVDGGLYAELIRKMAHAISPNAIASFIPL